MKTKAIEVPPSARKVMATQSEYPERFLPERLRAFLSTLPPEFQADGEVHWQRLDEQAEEWAWEAIEECRAAANERPAQEQAPEPVSRPSSVGPILAPIPASSGDDAPSGNHEKSKAELLAKLMREPETYDRIGAAWRLVVRLLTSKDGTLVGSYRDMAGMVGSISGDTVKNWVKHLVEKGVITSEQKGRQIALRLTEEYMRVAMAPERVETTVEVLPPEHARLGALKKLVDGAARLGGRVKLSLEDCELGKDDESA